jgi:hypothetical protein
MSMKEAVHEIGQGANAMPLECGITLPIVKVENNRIIVRRLIYFTRITPDLGTAITAPQYVASYDLSAAAFISLERFDEDVPNLGPPPWIHNRPAFDKPEDIIPEFNRLWTLYDILIPAFVRREAGISAEVGQAAKDYIHYFDRHAEKPLLPYYQKFGGDFLHWVVRISSSQ